MINLPYPNDTLIPNKDSWTHKDSLIYENERSVIFKLQHILGCSSNELFAIFKGMQNSDCLKYNYLIYRWDNTGGWQKIYSDDYFTMEEAKRNLIPIAKYFV